ncbi:MAG: DNA-binding protein [Cyanobacteria bacterium P01_C01_bin.120]
MASITIDLSDSQLQQLQELATAQGIAVDTLVKAGVQDWLNSQQSDFIEASNRVLKKNAELYQRLA